MIAWMIAVIIAMGSPSSTVIRDSDPVECEYSDQCVLRVGSHTYATGYTLPARADHLGCYARHNVHIRTLRLIPNDSVLTSCISYDSYMVIYQLSPSSIGIDLFKGGYESIRTITIPEIR